MQTYLTRQAASAIQCSSTSTTCRDQTAVSCPRNVCNVYNSSHPPFVSMRRLHLRTLMRAHTMDTAATVTEPLVTPFLGLSVVQVINTDLHILFSFDFLCFFCYPCPLMSWKIGQRPFIEFVAVPPSMPPLISQP